MRIIKLIDEEQANNLLGAKKKNTIHYKTEAERGQSKKGRTDDLPGVGLAAEDPHEVGHRDAPRPLDVKELKRPANVVFADEDVPVNRCRQELLFRREKKATVAKGEIGERWAGIGREWGRKRNKNIFSGG